MFSTSLSTSALAKVTTAASVAGLSLVGRNNAAVQQSAYFNYGQAIVSLAQAMKDENERNRNETLLACVLMVVVESMLARDRSPDQQWAAHIGGACQLLLQRGRANVSKDPIARRLWAVVRGFLFQNPNSPITKHEMFASAIPMSCSAGQHPPPPEIHLGRLTLATTGLRSRGLAILNIATPESAQLELLVRDCQAMDTALLSWANGLPQAYQYSFAAEAPSVPSSTAGSPDATDTSPRTSDDTKEQRADNVHHYPDSHLQRLWNSYRAARVAVNALLYRTSMLPTQPVADSYDLSNTSGATLESLATEIVASVPYRLLDSSLVARQSISSPPSEISLAYYCLWPLYVAHGIAIIPHYARSHIVSVMARIVDKYEIRNGKTLVDVTTADNTRPLWCGPWQDGWVEFNWEWAFLYGCGAV
jgi:hypothetical protein